MAKRRDPEKPEGHARPDGPEAAVGRRAGAARADARARTEAPSRPHRAAEDPFATFTEWASDADTTGYADL